MKLFIKKAAVFLVLLMVVISLICLYTFFERNAIYHSEKTYNLNDESITTIILGDSHAKCGFNPAVIKNSVNISQNAEYYIYTYYKLKKFIESNPQLENIVLSFGYNNIANRNYAPVFRKSLFQQAYRNYLMILDEEGLTGVKTSQVDYKLYYAKYKLGIPIKIFEDHLLFKKLFVKHITYRDLPFVGNFSINKQSHINNELKDYAAFFYNDDGTPVDLSQDKIKALKKIVYLCEKNDLKLYLVNTPLHHTALKKMPAKLIDYYNNLKTDLEKSSHVVTCLDLVDYELSDDYFLDYDHVNYKGADLISTEVNNALSNNELVKN